MNILQAVKMALKSIWGKKGRSTLTILGIFIGIAAVMTIVSIMEGMKELTRQQYEAMGSNRVTVYIWSYMYDDEGNSLAPDYFPKLYEYCNGLKDQIEGVTPEGYLNATVVYGTKSTDNMGYEWDENGNLIGDTPPSLYYASDQYSVCNNLTVARGRDLAYLDMTNYNQVCVMGAQAAEIFFGSGNPVGQEIQVNGNPFLVVGVYESKSAGVNVGSSEENQWIQETINRQDYMILLPSTMTRIFNNNQPIEQYIIKAKDTESLKEVSTLVNGFLAGFISDDNGYYYIDNPTSYQNEQAEADKLQQRFLGGIAAISLLVGGIGIMNIMLVTVTERTREIGIRKAIGAERKSIIVQFLIEAAMICGIGGIFGIIVGYLGTLIVGKMNFDIILIPSAGITVGAFLISVALGIIFGLYPAVKASGLQPVDALRAD